VADYAEADSAVETRLALCPMCRARRAMRPRLTRVAWLCGEQRALPVLLSRAASLSA